MGKYEKKRAKKSRKGMIVATVLVIAVILLALFVMPQVLYRLNNDGDTGDFSNTSTTEPKKNGSAEESTGTESDETVSQELTGTALEFPYLLADGKLEIESIFQFDGINPDCDKQKGVRIAAMNLKNVSEDHLSSADITVFLNDGTELKFAVCDLPAEKTAMAFSLDNQELAESAVCTDIRIEAIYADSKNEDRISVSVDGMSIVVENTADTDIHNIVVYYRDVFNEDYFGGVAYGLEIEKLSAGESTTITAEESLLGVIEVVRIAVNDQN